MAKITLTRKQAEAYKATQSNQITLYGGAIRGGKSYWLLVCIFTYAMKYPNSRWVILRETLPTIKRTILVTWRELMGFGIGDYVARINEQDHEYTFNNGSVIMFMSENYDSDKELNRFKGLEVNGFGIDEMNEVQELTFYKCIERAGSWQHSPGCPPIILGTCNPTQNWVKEKFYEPWKNGTLKTGWAYVPAKITDNPHLSQQYIEGLKLLPTYQYAVFVEGDWDIALKQGGEFYKCFELNQHVKTDLQYDPTLPLHISFDDNVNPYLPCGIFQIHGKKVRMIDEIVSRSPANTIKGITNELKRRYPTHDAGLFIYGDATADKEDTKMEKGHSFYTLIRDYLVEYKPRMRVMASNPSVAMRGNWINTIFENELDGISIEISNKCTTMINDLVNIKEAADGTKNKEMETDPKTKVRYQKWGHFTDLLDYLLCSAFSSEYNKYQRGGSAPVLTYGKPISKNSF